MKSITKLRKIGGSLVATIPKNVVELEGLNEGQIVKIKVEKVKISGFGALKGIGSFTKEDKKWIEGKHFHD